MTAVIRDAHNRFRVRFAELERGGVFGLFRPPGRDVDPFLICRAIAEIMRHASLRSPAGRPLLWNDYRVVLAPADLEPLRALEGRLQGDLETTLAAEAANLGAEVVGDLCIHLVADESGELPQGEAVVRVEFAPAGRAAAPGAGDLTVRLSGRAIAGMIENATVLPATRAAAGRACRLAWQGGSAAIAPGATTVVGRAHSGQPERFVPLAGVSTRISKQHVWILPDPAGVSVGRFASANPVEVDGKLVTRGQRALLVRLPVEISLSRGELVLALSWL